MGVAVAEIEVHIVVIFLILVSAIHVGVIAEVIVCSVGELVMIIVAVGIGVIIVVVGQFSAGGSRRWGGCRSSGDLCWRIIVVAATTVSENRLRDFQGCLWGGNAYRSSKRSSSKFSGSVMMNVNRKQARLQIRRVERIGSKCQGTSHTNRKKE